MSHYLLLIVRRMTVVVMRVRVILWLDVVLVVAGEILMLLIRATGCLWMVTLIRISSVSAPRFMT